jgi:hypothetical protein
VSLDTFRRKEYRVKRAIIGLIMLLVAGGFVAADLFEDAEELRSSGDRRGAMQLLEDGLARANSPRDRAEFYWRMSEVALNMGDDLEDQGRDDDRLALYEQGEEFANLAIEANPQNHMAYYFKSSNIGRWGQTKGILQSLFKAGDMRDNLLVAVESKPNFGDGWNVLGMLYAAVPGRPVSFGNMAFAVSLSRKAMDSRQDEIRRGEEEDMGVGIREELANNLWARDWSASKRNREQDKMKRQFDRTNDLFEQALYYEGTIRIPNVDDRTEAMDVLRDLIRWLRSKPEKTPDDLSDIEKFEARLAEWQNS